MAIYGPLSLSEGIATQVAVVAAAVRLPWACGGRLSLLPLLPLFPAADARLLWVCGGRLSLPPSLLPWQPVPLSWQPVPPPVRIGTPWQVAWTRVHMRF